MKTMLSCSYLTEREASAVGDWLGVSDKSEEADEQMDDLQQGNYQPGDRVKSKIQLWEGKVEGPRPKGKAARQVNQVLPFSLQDDSRRGEGHKPPVSKQTHYNQKNHDHLHEIENHAQLNHGLGHHFHENYVQSYIQSNTQSNTPDHCNNQNHNPEKYINDMGEIHNQETRNKKHQVHNHENNHNHVQGLKTSLQKVRENCNVPADQIRTNGKMSKDEEKAKLFQEPKENLGESISTNVFSKPNQNQSNREILLQESKGPSESTENLHSKSESEIQKAQETQSPKKEGWNSKFSGILGGQGGFGWVQGKQLSN